MEVAHTNPIMIGEFYRDKNFRFLFFVFLAFCYSFYDDIIQRRSKQYDDNECCITNSTTSNLIRSNEIHIFNIIKKKKQARFRWFLAYTILHNFHLFELRKQNQIHLARLYIQRNNLINEQSIVDFEDFESSIINQEETN